MSVQESDVIDFVGTDKRTGAITLSISDHLDWQGANEHLFILQAKLNRYVDFIESGDIYEHKKPISGKKIIIQVIGRYNPPDEAAEFYKHANQALPDLNVEVLFVPSLQ